MLKSKILIAAAALGCIALLASVSLLANAFLGGARIDMTEEKLYTLSDGTKELLGDLSEPITARFFYSAGEVSGIPALQAYAERVKTLLKVYEDLSDGQFTLEIIDPEPYSREEDDAVAFGVDPVPLDNAGARLYFGLALSNSTDDSKAFPFLNPEREQFLEYDLTRAVYDLSLAKKPKVAIISGIDFAAPAANPFMPSPSSQWTIMDYVKEEFDAEILEGDAPNIPQDADILVWIYPDLPSDDLLKKIDRFVVEGGKLIVMQDPYPEWGMDKAASDGVEKLLAAWGVAYNSDNVALDIEHAARSVVMQPDLGGGARQIVLDKPNWIVADESGLNPDAPSTANLQRLFFKSAGFFTFAPENDSGLQWSVLAHTGKAAQVVTREQAESAEELLRSYRPSGESLALAGQLSGQFPSAFEADPNAPYAPKPGVVVLIADTDFLHDSTWIEKQPFMGDNLEVQIADNGPFLLNAVETLAGSDIWSSLRGRSRIDRPFDKVNALRRDAERDFLHKQQALQEKIQDTQQKLAQLRQSGGEREAVITAQERQEMERFTQELIATRSELRDVQHSLHKDIEALGTRLKLIHIAIIPLFIVLLGLILPGRTGVRRNG